MDTALVLNLVRGRLDDIDSLKEEIGGNPSVNLRMEIALDDELLIVSISDTEVVVRDAKRDEIVAQGAPDLARFAIRGMDSEVP